MTRSTRWILGGFAGIALLVVALLVWSWLAERHAVAQLLATGATVAFESDKRSRDLLGSHSSHNDDRRSLFALAESDQQIINQRSATPAGSVWGVSLPNRRAVKAVREAEWAFSNVEDVFLEEGVDDDSTRRFLDAALSDAFSLKGVTCYAKIDQQATLDQLLSLGLQDLLIGCPSLGEVSLAPLANNTSLRSLWLNEGPSGCEVCGLSSRYDATDLAVVVKLQQLEILVLAGLRVTDEMAGVLAGAAQLKQLSLSGCEISEMAATELEASLQNTQVKITRPDDDHSLSADE